MPLHRSSCRLIAVICCLGFGSVAHAADQGITGKKLLLKTDPKMVLLSKDALVVPGAAGSSSDPRCVAAGGSDSGASVKLSDGTNSVTLSMPCANWSANSAGTLYKYKDTTGTPKVGKVKAGLLKVVSPGMGAFPVPNGAATVTAEVTIGADKYCMTFTGTGDGSKFLVKDASTGTCAPTVPTCGNNVREGVEQCDGSDDTACPGQCLPGFCSCQLSLPCGNNVREGTEQCDGSDAAACPGLCLADCTCFPTTTCGNNVREGTEACDGTDATACPGQCQSDCTCPVCGNNLRDGTEECDGTDSAACPNNCAADCTCGAPTCGAGVCGVCAFGDLCKDFGLFGGCNCESGTNPQPCLGGDSYPTCGGTCPAGFVCQSSNTVEFDDLCLADNVASCFCVPSTSGCGATATCHPALDPARPGVCPAGQACLSLNTFCDPGAVGDCEESCCVPSGESCPAGGGLKCCSDFFGDDCAAGSICP